MRPQAPKIADSHPAPSRQIVGIDLLRFAAAALVVVYHLGYWAWVNPAAEPSLLARVDGTNLAYPGLAPVVWFGWIGVEVFFVISGFVIVFSARGSAWAFARSRLLRLVPAAWICSAIGAAILGGLAVYPLASVGSRLARSAVFWPVSPWVDGAYWTLGIEVAFYALVGIALAAGQRARLGAVLAVLGAISTLYWLLDAGGGVPPGSVMLHRIEQLLLVRHGCFFAVGGLLYLMLSGKASARAPFAIGIALLGCVLELVAHNGDYAAIDRAHGFAHPAVVPVVAWLATVAFIVVAVRGNAWLARIVPGGVARSIGLATYPLYLLHDDVGALTMRIAGRSGIAPGAALAASVGASLVAAVIVARVAEPRLRTVMARGLDRAAARVGARSATRIDVV
jgi:peptidoglycan/LPS O-acetylase OafA/YrhL